ncbi:glycosyltransferase family 4 protein [Streptomyces cavernae]|uniref:glycosyltransferase family 4 protein n=1 Tax=Streptomyces cavernae TaxID=2259034 RepID=UPI001EE3BD44|nr:glycosyltransferase family 4 protein [Streptomyces cavernae]
MNLAGALALRHDVEVVSVFRTSDRPTLGISGKVKLTPLVDERPEAETFDGRHPLMAQPSAVVPSDEVLVQRYTALSDERLLDYLQRTDADVVIATRPALVVFLARHGSKRYLRIGQEHLSYDNHTPGVRIAQNEAIGRLDAFVTVSARDAEHHRAELPGVTARITDISNAVPRSRADLSDGRAPLVVAAGRLARVKRYDLLIEAFAKVHAERPEWGLRIYGQGPQKPNLQADIDRLRLNDHVRLMGPHGTMETEWAKGSIAAVTSDWESFGMTIIEAMHAGVPVVATDCPHGPGEIITDGTDGLLVPQGDAEAIAAGLLKLMDNADERRRMGEAARVTAQKYAPRKVAGQYESLINELRAERVTAMTKLGRRMRKAVRGLLPAGAATKKSAPQTSAQSSARTAAGTDAEPAAARHADGTPRPLRPKAGCRVDGQGDVLVSVAPGGVSGTDLSLVVRLRKSEEEFRVPLEASADAKAPWTARLSRHSVPEGRWDMYVERAGDGMRRRVKARLVEQRALLTVAPAPQAWWIPYATKDGYLALRTFRRTTHAEVTAVRAGEGSVTVEGALYGVTLGDGAALVGVARGEDLAGFEVAAEGSAGTWFQATVASVPGSGHPDKREWDLFLRPAEGAELVRVGRVSDDIVDRKGTDRYPAAALAGGEVRPFFTVTNDLAFSAAPKSSDGSS